MHVVWLVKFEAEKGEFATVSIDGDGVSHIAKQMDCTNQDVVGENCVHNDTGELTLANEDKLKVWVEHYARVLNVEFGWPSNELHKVHPTAGLTSSVSTTLIHKALSDMKCYKGVDPCGIIAEMLNAACEEGVELARWLTGAVFVM